MQSSNNYTFTYISLINRDKSYDISQMVKYITIHESIESMFLTGEVYIQDAGNHLDEWNIHDESWIFSFGFFSPSLGYEATVTLNVFGISDYVKESDTIKSYKLLLCSPEGIKDKMMRISKGYAGTKKAIISDILHQIGSNKLLFIDDNNENTKILIPKMQPFDAIGLMLLYNDTTPDYLFWESLKGFHCQSVSKILTGKVSRTLYEHNTNLNTDKSYMSDVDALSDPNMIQSYKILKIFNQMSEMEDGSIGATAFVYDLLTGKNDIYKINESKADARHYLYFENSLNYANYLQRHKILFNLDNHKWTIECNGDYNRHCGELVNINMLRANNDNPGFMSMYCGNFVITDIIHYWDITRYTQSISVSR